MKLDFKNKNVLFIDIDDVLALVKQFHSNKKKWHPVYDVYRFDTKCVNVFNEICETVNPIIVLSSDWKYHYNLHNINEIFQWNGISYKISTFTPSLWGIKYTKIQELEECRAHEILDFVKKHNIKKYVAVDDLNLTPWLAESNFVCTPRPMEGIKQSGVKEKIIKNFNL